MAKELKNNENIEELKDYREVERDESEMNDDVMEVAVEKKGFFKTVGGAIKQAVKPTKKKVAVVGGIVVLAAVGYGIYKMVTGNGSSDVVEDVVSDAVSEIPTEEVVDNVVNF